jgi:hypothetical protein
VTRLVDWSDHFLTKAHTRFYNITVREARRVGALQKNITPGFEKSKKKVILIDKTYAKPKKESVNLHQSTRI